MNLRKLLIVGGVALAASACVLVVSDLSAQCFQGTTTPDPADTACKKATISLPCFDPSIPVPH